MEVPRYWRLKQQTYGLVGNSCPHCESNHFPPRDICPDCNTRSNSQQASDGKENTYEYTFGQNVTPVNEPYQSADVNSSAGITSNHNGINEIQEIREAENYSKILRPEVDINETGEIIIYQANPTTV